VALGTDGSGTRTRWYGGRVRRCEMLCCIMASLALNSVQYPGAGDARIDVLREVGIVGKGLGSRISFALYPALWQLPQVPYCLPSAIMNCLRKARTGNSGINVAGTNEYSSDPDPLPIQSPTKYRDIRPARGAVHMPQFPYSFLRLHR